MKKIIIVAGSCNTGKTSTTNALIKELINDGYEVDCLNGSRFWEKMDVKTGIYNYSGDVILNKNGEKILIVTYGDTKAALKNVLIEENLKKVDIVVCCSRSACGKQVFDYMSGRILEWFKSGVKVIPLYKNLMCHNNIKEQENKYFTELIKSLL